MKMDSVEAGRRTSSRRSRGATARRSKTTSTRQRASTTRRKSATSKARRSSARTSGVRGRQGASSQTTTDLNEIRQWAEARGGKPVSVRGTSRSGGAGLLRIDFPGYTGAGRFDEISWDEWYQKFRESNLEFLYQDRAANGGQSKFFKLVNRGTVRGNSTKSRSGSRSQAKRSTGSRGTNRTRSRATARRR